MHVDAIDDHDSYMDVEILVAQEEDLMLEADDGVNQSNFSMSDSGSPPVTDDDRRVWPADSDDQQQGGHTESKFSVSV